MPFTTMTRSFEPKSPSQDVERVSCSNHSAEGAMGCSSLRANLFCNQTEEASAGCDEIPWCIQSEMDLAVEGQLASLLPAAPEPVDGDQLLSKAQEPSVWSLLPSVPPCRLFKQKKHAPVASPEVLRCSAFSSSTSADEPASTNAASLQRAATEARLARTAAFEPLSRTMPTDWSIVNFSAAIEAVKRA